MKNMFYRIVYGDEWFSWYFDNSKILHWYSCKYELSAIFQTPIWPVLIFGNEWKICFTIYYLEMYIFRFILKFLRICIDIFGNTNYLLFSKHRYSPFCYLRMYEKYVLPFSMWWWSFFVIFWNLKDSALILLEIWIIHFI